MNIDHATQKKERRAEEEEEVRLQWEGEVAKRR
jgi:hypothetical protein